MKPLRDYQLLALRFLLEQGPHCPAEGAAETDAAAAFLIYEGLRRLGLVLAIHCEGGGTSYGLTRRGVAVARSAPLVRMMLTGLGAA